LEDRSYTTVSAFSRDLAHVFTSEIGVDSVGDTAELQVQISGRAPELSLEQREKRKLAKRIIKAIQPSLEESLRKESELNGKPFEKELRDLDLILENSVLSRRTSLITASGDIPNQHDAAQRSLPNDVGPSPELELTDIVRTTPLVNGRPESPDVNEVDTLRPLDKDQEAAIGGDSGATSSPRSHAEHAACSASTPRVTVSEMPSVFPNGVKRDEEGQPHLRDEPTVPHAEPPTPPMSLTGDRYEPPLAQGGIQWYMQPFDPIGTTIHEERWTGREVLRGMSEELSEIDEDQLRDLVGDEAVECVPEQVNGASQPVRTDTPVNSPMASARTKVPKTRKRWKGFK
jgi:NuA3 HAT complex component NTO1